MREPYKVQEFMDYFNSALSQYPTVRAAYDATESWWMAMYGERFYANYESFRAAKSYFLKNRPY